MPVDVICKESVEVETMLSKLKKHKNKSDISYVDFSLGGIAKPSIIPLNEIFCDNINVFTPIKNQHLSN